MKNLSSLALCWATILSLVAVALGQQQSDTQWRNAPQGPPPTTIDTTGIPIERALPNQSVTGPGAVFVPISGVTNPAQNSPNQFGAQPALPAPDPSGMRAIIEQSKPAGRLTINNSPPHGELGVWMGETGGPGVRILRVTADSAAAQAGLRAGDVILQVDGQGASSPRETAQLIRQIAIGQPGNLTVWRNGNTQQIQFTLQPSRDIARGVADEPSHQVAFGTTESGDTGLSSRTQRLEQQINSLTQELASLRQELAQLKSAGPVQTGYNSQSPLSTPPQDRYIPSPNANAPEPPNPTPSTAQQFVPTEEKPAKPIGESPKPTPPPATPAASPKPPAPAAEKSRSNDLFAPESAPKSEDRPKSQDGPKSDDKPSDDLFK